MILLGGVEVSNFEPGGLAKVEGAWIVCKLTIKPQKEDVRALTASQNRPNRVTLIVAVSVIPIRRRNTK